MSLEENKEIGRKMMEAVNKQDLGLLRALSVWLILNGIFLSRNIILRHFRLIKKIIQKETT